MADSPYNLSHGHHLYDDLKRARYADEESVRLSPDHARAPSNLGPCTVRRANT